MKTFLCNIQNLSKLPLTTKSCVKLITNDMEHCQTLKFYYFHGKEGFLPIHKKRRHFTKNLCLPNIPFSY